MARKVPGDLSKAGKLPRIDLVGRRYGQLVVIDWAGRQRYQSPKTGKVTHTNWWKFKCDCGQAVTRPADNVGERSSCGCHRYVHGDQHPRWKGCGRLSASYWARIRLSAEKRDIDFNIAIDDAWDLLMSQDFKCALSGLPIDLHPNAQKRGTASLDRIDSDGVYEGNNVHWVHKDVNLMKHVLSVDRFVEVCSAVAKHNRKTK